MARASRGLIPKNSASNSPASWRNPPAGVYPWSEPRSQPRSVGNADTASVPVSRSRHSAAGESTPPGSRQLMPMTATASSPTGVSAAGVTASGVLPVNARWRCSASSAGAGWSKTREAGSRIPVSAASRSRSSTAVNESNPSSWNAVSAWMAAVSRCPSTEAASARTSSRVVAARSAGVSPSNRVVPAGWGGPAGAASTSSSKSRLGRAAV